MRNVLVHLALVGSALAHGDGTTWEWSGLFELGVGRYRWTFYKNADGVYGAPDASMRVAVLRGGSMPSGLMVLDNMHEAAEMVMATASGCLAPGSDVAVRPSDDCFDLVFDQSSSSTEFFLDVGAAGRFAVFTAHDPHEFAAHYLVGGSANLARIQPTTTYMHADVEHFNPPVSHSQSQGTTSTDAQAGPALVVGAIASVLALLASLLACYAVLLLLGKARVTAGRVKEVRAVRGDVSSTATPGRDAPVSVEEGL